MLASHRWLAELSGIDASSGEMAERLTALGLEVEGITCFEAPPRVVVAKVVSKEQHPKRDKLTVVRVDDGEGVHTVCCGAPNVPEPGGSVLFAQVGAVLPLPEGGPLEIAPRKLGGIESRGMICSEAELDLGGDGGGVFVFGEGAPAPGTRLSQALPVGDVVFEIGLTPNRPDCLGHLGLARDLAAGFGVPFEAPVPAGPRSHVEGFALVPPGQARVDLQWASRGIELAIDESLEELLGGGPAPFGLHIADPARCPRYGAAFVLNTQVGPSPFWLRYRLHVLGHRSLGNLVDATNYVMLERGHPIHGFDLQKLRGRRIEVRLAARGERITTLDGEDRELSTDDLLICDGEGPVALAGVMGAENSEIGEATRHVAIECAYFDPRSVRRTSRRTALHTDASHRFERGVDPNAVPAVLARAAGLIASLGNGVALTEALDVVARPIERRSITLRYQRLAELAGIEVPAPRAREILVSLGCELEAEREVDIAVRAPTWRPDLTREVDLVEEVVRVFGYEHIPTQVPRVHPSAEGTAPPVLFERALRQAGAAAGLFETVNFAFVPLEDLRAARASTDAVVLANPLKGRSVMRTSLLPGLARAGSHALRRQAEQVALYEVGHVFHPRPDVLLPRETPILGIFVAGRRSDWLGAARDVDFYDLKGYVEAFVESATGLRTRVELREETEVDWLHPRRQARLLLGEHIVGRLGELHPEVGDAFELGDVRGQYAELEVTALREAAAGLGVPQAEAPPRYPGVTRDVALLVQESHPAGVVREVLREGGGALVESVELFDLFRGQRLPEGTKSLAFRIAYRDPEGTLTDKRVDKAHMSATKAAQKQLGAIVR